MILLLHAFSLAHARGGSQTRTGFCLSLPLTVDGHAAVDSNMQQWIRYCRSNSSNIIVRLPEEAKSQAQPERGSCEPWSTHIKKTRPTRARLACWHFFIEENSVSTKCSSRDLNPDELAANSHALPCSVLVHSLLISRYTIVSTR